MISRPEKLSDALTILYEIDMFRYSASKLLDDRCQLGMDQYVHLECFLLHFRNLIEFLGKSSKGKSRTRDDDLHIQKPADIWPVVETRPAGAALQRLHERGKGLWEKYEGEGKTDKISKYLQHCTKSRTDTKEWDVGAMCSDLEPLICELERLLPAERLHWEKQRPIVDFGVKVSTTFSDSGTPSSRKLSAD